MQQLKTMGYSALLILILCLTKTNGFLDRLQNKETELERNTRNFDLPKRNQVTSKIFFGQRPLAIQEDREVRYTRQLSINPNPELNRLLLSSDTSPNLIRERSVTKRESLENRRISSVRPEISQDGSLEDRRNNYQQRRSSLDNSQRQVREVSQRLSGERHNRFRQYEQNFEDRRSAGNMNFERRDIRLTNDIRLLTQSKEPSRQVLSTRREVKSKPEETDRIRSLENGRNMLKDRQIRQDNRRVSPTKREIRSTSLDRSRTLEDRRRVDERGTSTSTENRRQGSLEDRRLIGQTQSFRITHQDVIRRVRYLRNVRLSRQDSELSRQVENRQTRSTENRLLSNRDETRRVTYLENRRSAFPENRRVSIDTDHEARRVRLAGDRRLSNEIPVSSLGSVVENRRTQTTEALDNERRQTRENTHRVRVWEDRRSSSLKDRQLPNERQPKVQRMRSFQDRRVSNDDRRESRDDIRRVTVLENRRSGYLEDGRLSNEEQFQIQRKRTSQEDRDRVLSNDEGRQSSNDISRVRVFDRSSSLGSRLLSNHIEVRRVAPAEDRRLSNERQGSRLTRQSENRRITPNENRRLSNEELPETQWRRTSAEGRMLSNDERRESRNDIRRVRVSEGGRSRSLESRRLSNRIEARRIAPVEDRRSFNERQGSRLTRQSENRRITPNENRRLSNEELHETQRRRTSAEVFMLSNDERLESRNDIRRVRVSEDRRSSSLESRRLSSRIEARRVAPVEDRRSSNERQGSRLTRQSEDRRMTPHENRLLPYDDRRVAADGRYTDLVENISDGRSASRTDATRSIPRTLKNMSSRDENNNRQAERNQYDAYTSDPHRYFSRLVSQRSTRQSRDSERRMATSFRTSSQRIIDSTQAVDYIPEITSTIWLNTVKIVLLSLLIAQIASNSSKTKRNWLNNLTNFVAVTKEKVL